MKTNFTMKKYFLAAFVMMAFVISSCEDDAPVVVEGAGIYDFGSATLVDGNVNDPNTTDMVIVDGMLLVTGQPGDVTLPAGEAQITTAFVDAVLRGAAPCESQDLTSWAYQINLKSDLNVAFICTSEADLSEDIGSWQVIGDKLSMSISVSFSPVPIPIVISSVVITDTNISGTIDALPMIRDAKVPVGGPLDGDITNTDPSNLNVQYIAVEVILNKAS